MTRLMLKLLAGPPGVVLGARDTVDELSIGRAPGNGWVLADPTLPQPILSRWHCSLSPDGNGWRVTDQSRHGTFLNAEQGPIGQGLSRSVQAGDRLRLGEYLVELYWEPPPSLEIAGMGLESNRHDDPLPPHRGYADGGLPSDFGSWASIEETPMQDHGSPIQDNWAAPPPIGRLPDDWDQVADRHAPQPGAAGRDPGPGIGAILPDDWDQEPDWDQKPVGIGAPIAAEPVAPGSGEAAPTTHPAEALQPPRPPRQPQREAAPPVIAGGNGDIEAWLSALMRGAQLSDPPTPAMTSDPLATLAAIGASFRALVDGVRGVLRSRSVVKREFRITQTMVQAQNGNPLKLAASDAAAAAALLAEIRPGQAAAAATEALRDLALHELAMVAAMREAARHMLLSVAPDRVQAEAHSLDALVPMARKARAFDAYVALHSRITRSLADDFDSTFGREFARAYERVIEQAEPDPKASWKERI